MTRIADYSISSAFRAAKKHLDLEYFVCYALIAAFEAGEITNEQLDDSTAVVMGRIRPEVSAVAWLLNRPALDEDVSDERALAYRHAWLDSLIDEFEGKPFATHWVVK